MKQARFAILAALALVAIINAEGFTGTHHLIRFIRPGQISGYGLETMQFSTDGSILAIATTDGVVSFISPENGEKVGQFKHQPFSMSFTQDGSRLLMIARNRTELLDMQAGIPIEIKDTGRQDKGVIGISIGLKDGKLVITNLRSGSPAAKSGNIAVGDELVGVGAGKTGDYRRVIGESVERTLELLQGRPGEYVRLKTVPKGTIEDRELVLRRAALKTTATGTEIVPFEEAVVDERLVWCISDGNQAFYRANDGRLVSSFRLEGIANNSGWHAISPDNKHCAFLGRRLKPNDREFGIEIYDLGTRERLSHYANIESRNENTFVAVNAFWGFHYAPDGKHLLVGNWGGIQVISAESGKELHQFGIGEGADGLAKPGEKLSSDVRLSEFTVSSRGLLAAGVGLGTVRLFDFKTGKYVHTLPQREDDNKAVTGMEFSPDGKWLAYYNNDRLHLVDVEEFYPKPNADGGADDASVSSEEVAQ